MIDRRSLPSAGRLKLALLMVLIGLLNLAGESQDDCCYNEEQGDTEPKLIEYIITVSPAEVTIEPGKKATVNVRGSASATGGGSRPPYIEEAIPWAVAPGGEIKDVTVTHMIEARAIVEFFSQLRADSRYFFQSAETYVHVYLSKADPKKSKSRGGYVTVKLLATLIPTIELKSIQPYLYATRWDRGEILIVNQGKDDLIITAFSFDAAGEPDFSISGPVLPIVLGSQTMVVIQTRYSGTTAKAKTTLIIHSNSPGRREVRVDLEAP